MELAQRRPRHVGENAEDSMTQTELLKKVRRLHWRSLERLARLAYEEGYRAGEERARGAGRRGRTVRADATVAGLAALVERHFGLDRYAFEIRVVHRGSGRRVPAADRLSRYRLEA
jgi:hypothetical protein